MVDVFSTFRKRSLHRVIIVVFLLQLADSLQVIRFVLKLHFSNMLCVVVLLVIHEAPWVTEELVEQLLIVAPWYGHYRRNSLVTLAQHIAGLKLIILQFGSSYYNIHFHHTVVVRKVHYSFITALRRLDSWTTSLKSFWDSIPHLSQCRSGCLFGHLSSRVFLGSYFQIYEAVDYSASM